MRKPIAGDRRMRPGIGVVVELMGLAFIFIPGWYVPPGLLFGLYVVLAELSATYLVHCPAHYAVGSLVGIRFRRMRLGRTTLAKALPPRFSRFARLLPVITLSMAKDSLAGVTKRKVALMYEAGTVASVSVAFVIAAVATPAESLSYAGLAWGVAVAYLIFDLVFSPRSGDLSRARAALRP